MVNIKAVRKDVDECAAACSHDVVLMAVSKTHPYEDILEAYDQGQRLFGENRVQEIEAKFPPLCERPQGMKLCLIGHLQRNKAKKALSLVDRIDSVDSIPLMDELEKHLAGADRVMDILFEVNSSGEEQKSGFADEDELMKGVQKSGFADEDELMKGVSHLADCPHLRLCGLMTVGPLGFDEEKNRKAFRYTRGLFDRLNEEGHALSVLSMGMSADYIQAIEEGSNEVRIGTAIFGERNYDV